MAFRSSRVTAGAARSKVADGSEANAVLLGNRDTTDSVFIGDLNVTVANGWELKPGQSIEVRLGGRIDEVHAITAAGDAELQRIYT